MVFTLPFFLPEGEVLLEELDDGLGIFQVVPLKLVDLAEVLLESVFNDFARFCAIIEHVFVEHREVEGEAELDGVASR